MKKQDLFVGSLKDRGIIKWTSMMLPEHVKMLQAWQAESRYIAAPDLQACDLAVLQEELEIAVKRKCQVLVKTWQEGEVRTHQGVIELIDPYKKRMKLQDAFSEQWIEIVKIIGIHCLE